MLDDGPVKFYRYIRDAGAEDGTFLFNNRDDLDDYPLVKMHDRVIKSRDGLDLVCYLSLPPGAIRTATACPNKPVPMVLDVHGGPWARDDWGLNPLPPMARQPRLRRAQRELPRLDRLRQGFHQRRQRRVVGQDARRPDRRRELGRRQEDRRARTRSPSWAAATAATPRSSA